MGIWGMMTVTMLQFGNRQKKQSHCLRDPSPKTPVPENAQMMTAHPPIPQYIVQIVLAASLVRYSRDVGADEEVRLGPYRFWPA
jgi:hypothetical protein